jgi:hypothetical protein
VEALCGKSKPSDTKTAYKALYTYAFENLPTAIHSPTASSCPCRAEGAVVIWNAGVGELSFEWFEAAFHMIRNGMQALPEPHAVPGHLVYTGTLHRIQLATLALEGTHATTTQIRKKLWGNSEFQAYAGARNILRSISLILDGYAGRAKPFSTACFTSLSKSVNRVGLYTPVATLRACFGPDVDNMWKAVEAILPAPVPPQHIDWSPFGRLMSNSCRDKIIAKQVARSTTKSRAAKTKCDASELQDDTMPSSPEVNVMWPHNKCLLILTAVHLCVRSASIELVEMP